MKQFKSWALLVGALLCCAAGNVDNIKAALANMNLGAAYYKNGELAFAKEKLERARIQDPKNAQVHGMLGLLYSSLGDAAKADASFKTALKLAPADPDLLNNYAVFLCAHGMADEGVKRFELAAANVLYKTPWAAYTNAGRCLRDAKRSSEAAALYDKALKSLPTFAEAIYQYADLELELKQPAAALKRVDTFVNYSPAPSADLLLTGWKAARAVGDQLAAIKYARRLQTEYRDSDQARAVIGGAGTVGR
jgi:type IV pilus assembly protein PilF